MRAPEPPPSNDPRWEAWCRPLLQYLERARSWADLKDWRCKTRTGAAMMQNMLSWLALRRAVEFEAGSWRAVSSGERTALVAEDEARIVAERFAAPTARPGPWAFDAYAGRDEDEEEVLTK